MVWIAWDKTRAVSRCSDGASVASHSTLASAARWVGAYAPPRWGGRVLMDGGLDGVIKWGVDKCQNRGGVIHALYYLDTIDITKFC